MDAGKADLASELFFNGGYGLGHDGSLHGWNLQGAPGLEDQGEQGG